MRFLQVGANSFLELTELTILRSPSKFLSGLVFEGNASVEPTPRSSSHELPLCLECLSFLSSEFVFHLMLLSTASHIRAAHLLSSRLYRISAYVYVLIYT